MRTESTASGTPGSAARATNGSAACVLISSEATRTGDTDPPPVVFLIGMGNAVPSNRYGR
ncbi:hypothetical protein GCM10010249_53680 [Streptomyces roseolilacinus]|uniref:Uncharacterized protein n=1 Tax=Streptomyces roseolilacinus TaxID=66904 RepID=A0A918B883_9ACTN|nr:hypothetical protein GCM10010249_53680 [Streptomyces roseolilacinus]